ncbi:MAG: methylenetetrahydrofolate--tRNA-(uracil(54)-C(5))-methyltransferase (FADH(2)-oxidizing) TrmFO [Erysipelotrichaceae bacterium]
MKQRVKVIGAGLAGCEAAYQLIKRGIAVTLVEQRPINRTEVHQSENFAELVCSNSLRSNDVFNAVGLLKEELRKLDSLLIKIADENKVPAGSALAVDRDNFSLAITKFLSEHPLVSIERAEYVSIAENEPIIIASGPLTSDKLFDSIKNIVSSNNLFFYDAVAPIISLESIDLTKAYFKSRYDKGEADYLNCPLNKEQFDNFYYELINAKTVELKEVDKPVFFEGCMPFEYLAKRGAKTLLFGPMKPVGLRDSNGNTPYAVVQLRQDDSAKTLFNIVGFQTSLLWPEQKRILRMIPGLENCEIVRYGVIHRNTYLNSPTALTNNYQLKNNDNIFFAGQITGVEGYSESIASGLVAGINMANKINGEDLLNLNSDTMIGAMANYISNRNSKFQPMNANFGLFTAANVKKQDKKQFYFERSMKEIEKLCKNF